MVVVRGTSAAPLEGKVALVTGGGRGIGKGYAVELARRGASVVINYNISAAAAEKTVQEIKNLGGMALALKANVTSMAEVSKMFEDAVKHFGRMDIVRLTYSSQVLLVLTWLAMSRLSLTAVLKSLCQRRK
jgi:NAD(P)-dependent dehydrogenase (short-subunit alcohol dehydrogenase family)